MFPRQTSSSSSSSVSSGAGSHGRRRSKTGTKPALTGDWYSCSQSSILTAMDRFVKAVNNMDATVLVPSKLRDMTLSPQAPITTGNGTDLHSFYQLLNNVKNELLWGGGLHEATSPTTSTSQQLMQRSTLSSFSAASSRQSPKPARSADELSLCTPPASSSSDTDSDADSMLTDERMDSEDDITGHGAPQSHLSLAFRHHLQGLNTILHQLSDSAEYLSSRYLQEVDDS